MCVMYGASANFFVGWENHMEGQKLKADGDHFRTKLDTKVLFDDWSRKVRNFHAKHDQNG